jgi:integrase
MGDLKTEASRKPLRLDPDLAQSLLAWRRMSAFNTGHDWVFASPEMGGKQPYLQMKEWRGRRDSNSRPLP